MSDALVRRAREYLLASYGTDLMQHRTRKWQRSRVRVLLITFMSIASTYKAKLF